MSLFASNWFLILFVLINVYTSTLSAASNYTSEEDKEDNIYAYEEGYCAPYSGKICKSFMGENHLSVWFSRKDPTGGWTNEKITSDLFKELLVDLPEYCRKAAEVALSREKC